MSFNPYCQRCDKQFCTLHISVHKNGWDECGSRCKNNECHNCLLERKIAILEKRLSQLL